MMRFEDLSIIIPTLRETVSFDETIEIILSSCAHEDIKEFIIVVSTNTSKESMEYVKKAEETVKESGIEYRIVCQKRPYLGGALQDGIEEARGSHLAIETADLNTAPENLSQMISIAKQNPGDIVSCSRWMKGGGFENYAPLKKIWNYCSQVFLRALYQSRLTDFTWGAHLVPSVLYKSIRFREQKHPFDLEEVVIPLRLGIHFHEIPGICHLEKDDVSVQPFWANLIFLRPAFKCRFMKKIELLKENISYEELKKILA